MSYEKRIQAAQLPIRRELWKELETISKKNLRTVITDLEHAVSHGYFGLAAELSDRIAVDAATAVAADPQARIRLEIERLKRAHYMGFVGPARQAANRVLTTLRAYRRRLDAHMVALWEFTAYGFLTWSATNPREVRNLVTRARKILPRLERRRKLEADCLGFLHAMEGRLYALTSDPEAACNQFEKATALHNQHNLLRSRCHVDVLYAEHLGLLNQWSKAVEMAQRFLKEAWLLQFKSHLLLRAIRLLLRAPRHMIADQVVRNLASRCQVLLYAMGLGQSRSVCPLIQDTLQYLPQSYDLDLFSYQWHSDLRLLIARLSWQNLEKFVHRYYEGIGFKVVSFPHGSEGLDLLASKQQTDGTTHAVGIQVKHWRKKLLQRDVPVETVFQKAGELAFRMLHRPGLSAALWYCRSGVNKHADELLRYRVGATFGEGCEVQVIDLDGLVSRVLETPDLLMRIFFSDEFRT